MTCRLLIIFFCFFGEKSFGQLAVIEKKFITKIEQATNDSNKIVALGELADYYYVYKLDKKADSVQQKQLVVAQLSNNKNLVLSALFGTSINLTSWVSNETYERLMQFIQKGENYAKESGREDYIAFAKLRKSALLRKHGEFDAALSQATLAFASLQRKGDDSLKASIFIELGNIFLAKGETVSAYQNYNEAFALAYLLKNIPLQSEIYHHLANLYNSLENKQMAERTLLKSLALNKSIGDKKGLLLDYIDLARYMDKLEYIQAAIPLANELQSERYKLFTKRLLLAYYTVIEKNSTKSLQFLWENEDVKQSFINQGLPYYHYNIGSIYKWSNKPDSAIYYYDLSDSSLKSSFGISTQRIILKDKGQCYILLSQPKNAIQSYERSLELGIGKNDLKTDTFLTQNLSKLYAQIGDYKRAYEYYNQSMQTRSSLEKLANQREVVLLEVARENQQYEKDLEDLEREARRVRNLQYIGITIAIAIIFLGMILIGMFPISRFTIRLLSFFAFICLFEFIIVLVDSYLHHATHGEPLKIWLAKILLIALLVPLQHFLEHKLVKFLESKRLLKMRQEFSFKKLWANIKKPTPTNTEAEFEKDTAVL
jgi:predicted negative regulator of RcsB-dependent stress response